jgi:hypothetical protein
MKSRHKKNFENKVYQSFSQQKNTAQKKKKSHFLIFEKKSPFDYRKIQKKTTVISSQTINQKKE